MNSEEIDSVLRRICGDTFLGVYARDQLPTRITTRPVLIVANTDPARNPGTHWIAMFFSADGTGEYFDSLAQRPMDTFSSYMNRHCVRWLYSTKQLQSVVSSFCGNYCVLYCAYRKHNYTLNTITSWFTSDVSFNDVVVHAWTCGRLINIRRRR
jgi:hypothetical protein